MYQSPISLACAHIYALSEKTAKRFSGENINDGLDSLRWQSIIGGGDVVFEGGGGWGGGVGWMMEEELEGGFMTPPPTFPPLPPPLWARCLWGKSATWWPDLFVPTAPTWTQAASPLLGHYVRIKICYTALQYNTMQYNTMQCNTLQYNTIQYNAIQYNTIQYNAMQCNAMQYTTLHYNYSVHISIVPLGKIRHFGSKQAQWPDIDIDIDIMINYYCYYYSGFNLEPHPAPLAHLFSKWSITSRACAPVYPSLSCCSAPAFLAFCLCYPIL